MPKATKMAQYIKVLAAKPSNQSSIPGPTEWKETTISHRLFSDLHTHAVASSCDIPK